MAETRRSRYDLDLAELTAVLDAHGQPPYRARQVWDGLYRRALEPGEMTELPTDLRARLGAELPAGLDLADQSISDRGDTVKWLWALGDGSRIETVLMAYPERATVCVSTQAGCAMGCGFCATGQAGFRRHLSGGEIVEQVLRAMRHSPARRVSNVVFMGMGEPLANYEATWSALRRLHGDVGISARHLTVSTVGIEPGIRRMAAEELPVNLAVSLHAADDELRDRLVPINRRYPLGSLMAACDLYRKARGRRLSFEWACIDGVNDRPVDARQLAELARPRSAHVNLIPLNPTPGWSVAGTPLARVRVFRDRLRSLGVNATVRQNRGTDIDAACGQLAASGGRTPGPGRGSEAGAPGPTSPPGPA